MMRDFGRTVTELRKRSMEAQNLQDRNAVKISCAIGFTGRKEKIMKTKQYFITCEHDNMICGEHQSTIGRASTIKSAKATISHARKNNGILKNPHNFKIYDCFADIDTTTGFVPCVYEEQ